MKITFLGATKMVTGSNFLVEGAGKKFLVDCGMQKKPLLVLMVKTKILKFLLKVIKYI